VLFTETDEPVVVKVATKAVTFVPVGTVAKMVAPLMVAVMSEERAPFVAARNLKAVMALVELSRSSDEESDEASGVSPAASSILLSTWLISSSSTPASFRPSLT